MGREFRGDPRKREEYLAAPAAYDVLAVDRSGGETIVPADRARFEREPFGFVARLRPGESEPPTFVETVTLHTHSGPIVMPGGIAGRASWPGARDFSWR